MCVGRLCAHDITVVVRYSCALTQSVCQIESRLRSGNSMNTGDDGCDWGYAYDRWHLQAMMVQSTGNRHCGWNCGCACCGGITAADRNGCRYNEIVFDGAIWRAQLPGLIEAVWYPVNAEVDVREGDKFRAWGARDSFAWRFPGRELPVFEYDQRRAEDGQPPFSESVRDG